jgi:predicted GNAT superfamily acetyltransferase
LPAAISCYNSAIAYLKSESDEHPPGTDTIEELNGRSMSRSCVGLDQRFAVPSNLMRAVSHDDSGGVVIGAFDGKAMIGMSFSLPVRRHGQWVLWSHMTGVVPDYQNRGIGFGLKQAQRSWALEYGYEMIA